MFPEPVCYKELPCDWGVTDSALDAVSPVVNEEVSLMVGAKPPFVLSAITDLETQELIGSYSYPGQNPIHLGHLQPGPLTPTQAVNPNVRQDAQLAVLLSAQEVEHVSHNLSRNASAVTGIGVFPIQDFVEVYDSSDQVANRSRSLRPPRRRRHRRRGWARPGSQKANFLSGQGTRCRCLGLCRRNLGSRRFNRSSLSSRGFELEWFLIRYHNRFNLLRDCQLGPGLAIKDIQLARIRFRLRPF